MYRGYQVDIDELNSSILTDNKINWESSEGALENEISSIRSGISLDISDNDNLEDPDGSIDAAKLVKKWFPVKSYDVFLSHSHADRENAIRFAVWLRENLGLKVFVDSTVWGYSDELLKQLDDRYCYQSNSKTYDYNKRNVTTAHVHLMLAMALQEMIDKSECFLFLRSGNSLSFSLKKESIAKSPWVFEELKTTSVIRKLLPSRESFKEELRQRIASGEFYNKSLQISYPVGEELNQLSELTRADLLMAVALHHRARKVHGLDALYESASLKAGK